MNIQHYKSEQTLAQEDSYDEVNRNDEPSIEDVGMLSIGMVSTKYQEFNDEVNLHLQKGDLLGLSNSLIINEDFMKLNDENIHNMVVFSYQNLH